MPAKSHESPAAANFEDRGNKACRTRNLAYLTAILPITVGLTGCAGIYLEQDGPVLPELTKTEATFQELVRNDTSVLNSLAAPAADCKACTDFAQTLKEHSSERANLLGGLWEPWEGETPEGAPLPEPVPEASATWAELATFLIESGNKDLIAAATIEEEHDRLAAASVASGRIADGLHLAKLANLEVELPSFATKRANLATKMSGKEMQALTVAVPIWDCAAQLIPLYTAADDTNGASATELRGRQQVEDLLRVSAFALSLGVPDERTTSCITTFENSGTTSLQGVEEELFAANLDLFVEHPQLMSETDDVASSLSYLVLLDHIRVLAEVGSDGTPGVQISDVPRPEPTEPTQFAPFYNKDGKPDYQGFSS
ncbi:MAG: hypothetical protein Q4E01_00925 [Actinomycetaceae bacterium]|nr:hypothetical protein [Actinomycetaceae bacterium]